MARRVGRALREWIAVLALAALPAATLGADAKSPVPPPDEQAKAEKTLRDLFKADFAARTPAAKKALAQKLMGQLAETEGDEAARYVLLRDARDVSVSAGDVETALAAATRLAKEFDVRAADAQMPVLTGFRGASGASAGAVARAALGVTDQAAAEDDFQTANRVASIAAAAASRSGDRQLAATARERESQVKALHAEFEHTHSALEQLKRDPIDPAANLVVGKYLCLSKGQWDRGLPYLVKSGDPKLRTAAKLDTSHPVDASKQSELAELWWNLAESARGLARAHLAARAAHWYKAALPDLSGLERVAAEKRLKQAETYADADPSGGAQFTTSAATKGVPLGMTDRNAGRELILEFEIKTMWSQDAVLLSKRHREDDAGITVSMRRDGTVVAAADASFYTVDVAGKTKVNDGKWHSIRVEKHGTIVKLFVDHEPQGEFATRMEFVSKSPWVLGWHGTWGRGALDAEFRDIDIESRK